jgi:hypothetical protein
MSYYPLSFLDWDSAIHMLPLCSGSPHGCKNRHWQLSNGFWQLSSRVGRQIGKNGRSVAIVHVVNGRLVKGLLLVKLYYTLNPQSLLNTTYSNKCCKCYHLFAELPALLYCLSPSLSLTSTLFLIYNIMYILWLLNMKFGYKRNDLVANSATTFS